MDGLSAFTKYMNGLYQCCANKNSEYDQSTLWWISELALYFDFTNINAFPNPLLCSKARFCSECGLSSREGITNDELGDAEEELTNIAMDNEFTCFSPNNIARC